MKVLALGGSGDIGQVAVRTILSLREVDQVVVADRDIDRASDFIKSLAEAEDWRALS